MRGDEAIGHVDAHNELRSGILREATRFGVTVDIGGPYKENDPGHVQEHEKTRAALDKIAKIAGITVTLPPLRKLGDHGHAPTDHDLLDQALDAISKADAWNDATGGAITTYSKDGYLWRCHTFSSSGSFAVTRSVRPWRVLIIGGGGAGGCGDGNGYGGVAGGGGGGGQFIERQLERIAVETHSITVGAGGQGTTENRPTSGGEPSIAFGITAFGGGGGGRCGSPGGDGANGGGGGGQGNPGDGDIRYGRQPGGGSTTGDGYPGGTGTHYFGDVYHAAGPYGSGGAGGGGAGGPGGTGPDTDSLGTPGGAGKASDITGSPVYYSGGGAGASFQGAQPSGGSGSGGDASGGNGKTFGGGGAGRDGYGGMPGSGASGAVMIAYQIGASA